MCINAGWIINEMEWNRKTLRTEQAMSSIPAWNVSRSTLLFIFVVVTTAFCVVVFNVGVVNW